MCRYIYTPTPNDAQRRPRRLNLAIGLPDWLFAFGADCAKTQKWSRWLTHAHYDVHRQGYERNDDDRQLGGGRGSTYGSPSRRVSDAFNRTFRRGSNAAQTQSGGLLSSGNLPSSMPRRAHGAGSMMISSEI